MSPACSALTQIQFFVIYSDTFHKPSRVKGEVSSVEIFFWKVSGRVRGRCSYPFYLLMLSDYKS